MLVGAVVIDFLNHWLGGAGWRFDVSVAPVCGVVFFLFYRYERSRNG